MLNSANSPIQRKIDFIMFIEGRLFVEAYRL